MKIALISFYTPTYYNHSAPSALPYYIIRDAGDDVDIKVWTFNYNCVSAGGLAKASAELGVEITDMGISDRLRNADSFIGRFRQIFARYPARCSFTALGDEFRKQIDDYNPDLVWIYLEEISHIANDFPDKPVIITTPDCISMFYHRAIKDGGLVARVGRWLRGAQYRRMERAFPHGDNRHYHLVGQNDMESLLRVNPKLNATFIRHPHYDPSPAPIIDPEFSKKRLKIVVPASVNLFTVGAVRDLVDMLGRNRRFAEVYDITLMGRGWHGKFLDRLVNAGYRVHNPEYVSDFGEELARHDIAIVPVSIGSGTKGKSLDALINGLLTIGTPVAMENIAVAHGQSALVYHNVEELSTILRDIPLSPRRYEAIAREGRKATAEHHGGKKTSNQFYALVRAMVGGR